MERPCIKQTVYKVLRQISTLEIFSCINVLNQYRFEHVKQIDKQLIWPKQLVVVAEWLTWTRNPLGSSRAGSNPADNV